MTTASDCSFCKQGSCPIHRHVTSRARSTRLKRAMKKCYFCERKKPTVKRRRYFNDIEDAEKGVNGCYVLVCDSCHKKNLW